MAIKGGKKIDLLFCASDLSSKSAHQAGQSRQLRGGPLGVVGNVEWDRDSGGVDGG